MKANSTTIAIIVLGYDSKKFVLDCLRYLKTIRKNGFEIQVIYVDNGSSDKTPEIVFKKYPEVIVIENRENYGFAKGVNFGVKFAYDQKFDYVLLLNPDVSFKENFLLDLVATVRKNSFLISGPKIITKDNKIWSLGGEIDKKRFSGGLIGYGEKDRESKDKEIVDYISGTAMFIHRSVFKKIGFFDEDYFLYYEDVDFCYRAKKAGINSYLVESSKIIHLESKIIKKNSFLHHYYASKSHLLFVAKRAPIVIKFRELVRTGKTILELLVEGNKTKKRAELTALKDFFLFDL